MKKIFYALFCCLYLAACAPADPPRPPAVPMDLSARSIIPLPLEVRTDSSSLAIDSLSALYFSADLQKEGTYLREEIEKVTGLNLAVNPAKTSRAYGHLKLKLTQNAALAEEGYRLDLSEDSLIIAANNPAGVFLGIQTLRQLLPYAESDTLSEKVFRIPTGKIIDRPEYAHRGVMLDVSRHFFTVAEVKKFIDYLAAYKINVLHLHLADDQGWRIEIKAYPELTKQGGRTAVGGGKGGFYTQADYKEIIQYAADRHITVIPEIDMPGHTNAALSSYAFLNCDGKKTKMYTGMRVGFSSFCIYKDTTYAFIDKVIGEIAALTPGAYFHIGGDEAHATKQKDYNYFVEKVQKIVARHGKKMVGWDEITAVKLDSGALAQHWQTPENAQRAKAQGTKIIMSPAKKAYLDMKYDSTSRHGLKWAGLIPVDTAYLWSPQNYLPGIGKNDIVGIEAPLWSETITDLDEAEYLLFPRLPGYAEIGWTPDSLRVWEDYKIRLEEEKMKWESWGADYRRE